MAVNKVTYGGETLIDLTGDTLTSASQLAQGIVAHLKYGTTVTGTMSGGGGGLPSGIKAIDFGDVVVSSDFTTSRQTFQHKLGETPDMMIVYTPTNIATTYSMLFCMRGNSSLFGWRSSAYNLHTLYHGNSTTTVTYNNSNSTTYGISNMTATSFQLASVNSNYYWRKGNYKYIAIKFG